MVEGVRERADCGATRSLDPKAKQSKERDYREDQTQDYLATTTTTQTTSQREQEQPPPSQSGALLAADRGLPEGATTTGEEQETTAAEDAEGPPPEGDQRCGTTQPDLFDSDQDTVPWGHLVEETGDQLAWGLQREQGELSRGEQSHSESEESHRRRRMHSHL